MAVSYKRRGGCNQFRGAAARLKRSLMASPRPFMGMAATAIPPAPAASARLSSANRFAAASRKSPDGDKSMTALA